MTENLSVEKLSANHRKSEFSSGNDELDIYLHRLASQHVRRGICQVYILIEKNSPNDVLGFYTLSSESVDSAAFPADLQKHLPYHPIPVFLIGRFAVSKASQRSGYGEFMITHAIDQSMSPTNPIGGTGLVVDPIDNYARSYYERYGFIQLKGSDRLFLQLKQI